MADCAGKSSYEPIWVSVAPGALCAKSRCVCAPAAAAADQRRAAVRVIDNVYRLEERRIRRLMNGAETGCSFARSPS
jgi:hypothetical protein